MRPNRKTVVDRTLAGLSIGALLAAGVMWAADVKADTVTGEGVLMPRGSTARQFGGVFCQPACTTVSSMPTSVRSQAAKLDAAVMHTTGPTTVVAHSLSAVSTHRMVAEWLANPETAPDPARVFVVTTGNPLSRYGGTQRHQSNAVPIPNAQPYKHLDVVNQYDSVADRPARWGIYSQIELSLARHLSYDEVDVDAPENLVRRDGNTTYMLVPAKDLRQLSGVRFLRDIGWVSQERYDEIDADRRAKIEADFDRPQLHEQGPGADWANGKEPESIRGESWDSSESNAPSRLSASSADTSDEDSATEKPRINAGSQSHTPKQDNDTTAATDADADTNGNEGGDGDE